MRQKKRLGLGPSSGLANRTTGTCQECPQAPKNSDSTAGYGGCAQSLSPPIGGHGTLTLLEAVRSKLQEVPSEECSTCTRKSGSVSGPSGVYSSRPTGAYQEHPQAPSDGDGKIHLQRGFPQSQSPGSMDLSLAAGYGGFAQGADVVQARQALRPVNAAARSEGCARDIVTEAPARYVLASAPDVEIAPCKKILQRFLKPNDWYSVAGDAKDKFHVTTLKPTGKMNQEDKAWRIAWLGKVNVALDMMRTMEPPKPVVVIAIAGGPECDYERGELFSGGIRKQWPDYTLKQIGDAEGLELFLEKQMK